jgi:hypothetical protein
MVKLRLLDRGGPSLRRPAAIENDTCDDFFVTALTKRRAGTDAGCCAERREIEWSA